MTQEPRRLALLPSAQESERLRQDERRVEKEYARRTREVPSDLYAPWRSDVSHFRASRTRLAGRLLHDRGAFPVSGEPCLEVGCGELGWLGELLCWGTRDRDLYGVDLGLERVAKLKHSLPTVQAVVGNAGLLPFTSSFFRLIVASTVFSSILDSSVRELVAHEMNRCLRPGGAILVYDFAFDNPRNIHVKAFGKREALRLFGDFPGVVRRVTLLPPLARMVAPRSWTLASLLEAIPFLRSHILAVFVKPC